MSAMIREQREYFVRRMNEITQEKIRAKEVELYGENGPQQPTWGMVFEAIKAGEIVLKEGTESLTRPYLMPTDVEWPALEQKRVDLQNYREQLARDSKAVMDKFMLAGVEGAVEALNAYAGMSRPYKH